MNNSLRNAFFIVLIYAILQITDYVTTYTSVCYHDAIEGNQYFIDLVDNYGYVLACAINLSLVASFMTALLLIARKVKIPYGYEIVGAIFISLTTAVILNNILIFHNVYMVSGILNSTFRDVAIKNPESFNRSQFCTLVKYLR